MLFYRNKKKKKLVIGIFLFLVLVFLLIENVVLRNTIKRSDETHQLIKRFEKTNDNEINLVKFDLNKPLEPNELYDNIRCKLTSKIAGIEITLCIDDENNDELNRVIMGRLI